MRRVVAVFVTILVLLMTVLPALAQEGDPLAESLLLPGLVGWVLAGLALLLAVIFRLWSARGPK